MGVGAGEQQACLWGRAVVGQGGKETQGALCCTHALRRRPRSSALPCTAPVPVAGARLENRRAAGHTFRLEQLLHSGFLQRLLLSRSLGLLLLLAGRLLLRAGGRRRLRRAGLLAAAPRRRRLLLSHPGGTGGHRGAAKRVGDEPHKQALPGPASPQPTRTSWLRRRHASPCGTSSPVHLPVLLQALRRRRRPRQRLQLCQQNLHGEIGGRLPRGVALALKVHARVLLFKRERGGGRV